MSVYTNRDAQTLVTAQEVGRGGEGAVYRVVDHPDVVAKIYHPAQRTHVRHAKLTAMVACPPQDSSRALRPPHVSLAWPTDLLFEAGAFVGFLMPRIEHSPNLVALFNPLLRRQRYPHADRRFLYHTAQNLAAVIATVHSSGHVVGDLNQKNILVKADALVTLVDTDSFQIWDMNGHSYRCPVGVPEYTPPELQGKSLATLERQPCHDCFGLSVLIFQLLMEGYHPFTGRPITAALAEVDQLSLHCMQQGLFPYNPNEQVQPPPAAPLFRWLPPEVQHLFLQSFLVGYAQPAQRPTAAAWAQVLGGAERALVHCHRQPAHWYSNHLPFCPECGQGQWTLPPTAQRSNGLREAPAEQNQPSSPQTTAQTGCIISLFKVGGALYVFVLLLMSLLNGNWFFLLVVFGLALFNTTVRHKVWQAMCITYRGLLPRFKQLWQVMKIAWRWLAPYLQQIWQAALAYWRSRPLLFKELTMIALLVLLFVLMSHFSGASSSAVNQGGGISPIASPPAMSPLVTPAATITAR